MASKSWWKVVDKLTRLVGSSMNLSSLFLVNDINTHFRSINTDQIYVEPAQLEIMSIINFLWFMRYRSSRHCRMWKGLPLTQMTYLLVFERVCPGTHTRDNTYFECFLSHPVSPKDLEDCKCATCSKGDQYLCFTDQRRPISVTNIVRFFERLINPGFPIEETGLLLYSFRSVCLWQGLWNWDCPII